MSQPITFTLETADFLLGRLIGLAETNKQLNEKVSELQRRVDVQSQMILSYEHEKDLFETKIKNLKSTIRKGTKK
jgi:hypothetical protein